MIRRRPLAALLLVLQGELTVGDTPARAFRRVTLPLAGRGIDAREAAGPVAVALSGTTATAQADLLGIFGREGLDLLPRLRNEASGLIQSRLMDAVTTMAVMPRRPGEVGL